MNECPESSSVSRFFKLDLSTGDGIAFASFVVAGAMSIGQCTSANSAAERQQQQNTVTIAVGVLSQKSPRGKDGDPEEFPADEQALRKWAVSALNESSARKVSKITGDAENALVKGGAVLWHDSGNPYGAGDTLLNANGAPILNANGAPISTGSAPLPKRIAN